MTDKVIFPKTITMPGSGIVLVQDAFRPETSHAIFPTREKSWNEFFQKMIDDGKVG